MYGQWDLIDYMNLINRLLSNWFLLDEFTQFTWWNGSIIFISIKYKLQ